MTKIKTPVTFAEMTSGRISFNDADGRGLFYIDTDWGGTKGIATRLAYANTIRDALNAQIDVDEVAEKMRDSFYEDPFATYRNDFNSAYSADIDWEKFDAALRKVCQESSANQPIDVDKVAEGTEEINKAIESTGRQAYAQGYEDGYKTGFQDGHRER